MANVNIKFNGKDFLLSCDDGQEEHLEELLIQRAQARTDKNWTEADKIRDKLSEMGVTVKDTPDGPIWDLS